MIQRVGPAGWLIDLQIRWWGSYSIQITFVILWVGILIGLLLVVGAISTLAERLRKK